MFDFLWFWKFGIFDDLGWVSVIFEAGFEFSVKNYPVSLVQTIISSKFDFLPPRAPPWGPIGGSQGPGAVEFCRPRRCRRVIIRAHPYCFWGIVFFVDSQSWWLLFSNNFFMWVWAINYATRTFWAAKFNRTRPLGPPHGSPGGARGEKYYKKWNFDEISI